VDLLNAILAYAMAGAFVLWLVAEDQEREGSSRVLRFVGAVIVALLFVGEDRDYHWWIALCVVVVLGAQGIALATALLGPLIPGPPP
jgi:hypothetical protein